MPYISCGPACFHITATLGICVPRNNDENTILMRNPARLYLIGRKKEVLGQDLHTTWPQGSLDLSDSARHFVYQTHWPESEQQNEGERWGKGLINFKFSSYK